MASCTKQTESIRQHKARKRASRCSMALKRRATPAFPIHPEGYDQNAPDAKPCESTKK